MYGPAAKAATLRGLKTVVYARPGYCGSSPNPGRSISDCTYDVAAILDAFNADRFLTVGWSGGGPYALACASLMQDRCKAAAIIAGFAPFNAEGLSFAYGMGQENLDELAAMLAGDPVLTDFLERALEAMANVSGAEMADSLGDLASSADRNALTGAFADDMATSFRRAISAGVAGWHDDDLALVRDWGFLPGGAPVALWHGQEDRMVPEGHSRWLAAHMAGVRAHYVPGEGHLSLFANRYEAILDDLLDLAG
jgi:pimeloyl-ACP methyl ester carboxylesterase